MKEDFNDEKKEEIEKEINKIMEELKSLETNQNSKKVKPKIIVISPFLFKNKFISFILMYLIGVFCFCGILGIFEYFQLYRIIDAFIIPLIMLMLEISFKNIIIKSNMKLVFKTKGMILSLITLITSIITMCVFETSFLGINEYTLLAFVFTYILVRYIIFTQIKQVYLKKQFFKQGGI